MNKESDLFCNLRLNVDDPGTDMEGPSQSRTTNPLSISAASGTKADAKSKYYGYISGITNREDAQEYLQETLDIRNPEHVEAIELYLRTLPGDDVEEFVAYNKFQDAKQDDEVDIQKRGKKKSKQQVGKEMYNMVFPEKPALPTKDIPGIEAVNFNRDGKTAKKKERTKYVPLFSGDATKAVMLPGRNKCDCCATKHQLVNNCLSCGRIVCLQEGSGPCMTCGDLVCSKEEQQILNRGSKKSEQLRAQLMKQGAPCDNSLLEKAEKDQKKAEEYKERLLDFDRTSARRTKVIDDEMDYFQTDSTTWLSAAEREKLRQREEQLRNLRHANKKSMKLSLDFAGRNVVLKEDKDRSEEMGATAALYGGEDDLIQSTNSTKKLRASAPADLQQDQATSASSVDPKIEIRAPKFVQGLTPRHADVVRGTQPTSSDIRRQALRNQDAELRELRDEGMCLSMHQPWASLLVRGIKKDEGRSWYSPHRGRLWIAATSKPVNTADVEEQQQLYLAMGIPREAFPPTYPSACLLGCVDVVECLPQSDYRKAYPDGESNSPFVFVCCNPNELVLKFPVSGKHKIYHLDPHVHDAAVKGIERAREFTAPA